MESMLNFDFAGFEFMNHLIDSFGTWLTPLMTKITWLGGGVFWVVVGLLFCIPKKTRKIGIAMLLAQLVMLFVNDIILKHLFSRTRPFALFNVEAAKRCVEGYDLSGKHYNGWMKAGYIDQVLKEISEYSSDFQQKWLSLFNGYSPLDLNYPYPHGYSFPSGHTSSSFAAACGLYSMAKGKGQKAIGWFAILTAAVIGFSRIYLHVHYSSDVIFATLVGILCAVAGYFLCKLVYPYVDKVFTSISSKKANKTK